MLHLLPDSGSIHTRNEEETLAWAALFAARLGPGDAVSLKGNLGAGKTVLSRGIVSALGLQVEVHSPTYSLVHEYHDGERLPVYHIDLYRLGKDADFEEIGLDYYRFGSGLTLVEWPERLREGELQFSWKVYLDYDGDSGRVIRWKKTS